MRLCRVCISFAVVSAFAAPPQQPYLAVIEKVAGAVAFYSEDGRELARVKVGSFPHEAALSPDGRRLYVSDNGVLWMTEDSLGANTISVLDVPSMKKLFAIDLGRFHRPHGIATLGDRLLATTERPFGLILVDPERRAVLRDFDVKGKSPHMVMPSPDGRRAFVSDSDSDCLAAIDLESGDVKTIATGAHPQGGVWAPDGKRLYITATNANRIDIVDPVRLAVTGSIPTGKGPARIAVTPDGKTLVYNLQFEPAVGFADTASGRQIAVVPVAGRPLSLTMTPDGRRAFAGLQEIDKLVFLSVPDRKVERVLDLPAGSGPDPAIPLRSPGGSR
jgi:YVTN family beta-propeller protein